MYYVVKNDRSMQPMIVKLTKKGYKPLYQCMPIFGVIKSFMPILNKDFFESENLIPHKTLKNAMADFMEYIKTDQGW